MRLEQSTFNAFAQGFMAAIGGLREIVTYSHKELPSSSAIEYAGLDAYVNIYNDNAIRDNPALANARRLRVAKADFSRLLCDPIVGVTEPSRFGTIIRTLNGIESTWQIVSISGDHAFWILQIQQRG